jgi:protein-disulfide isomerase
LTLLKDDIIVPDYTNHQHASIYFVYNRTEIPNLSGKAVFMRKLFVFALAAMLITTIITSITNNLGGIKNAYAQIQAGQSDLTLSNLIKQGQPYQGSKSAPVSLIMFGDFQCHDCGRFVKNTEPQINSTYIQTGKVIFVFVHIPNKGFDSWPAAVAAQCANEQGKFWQFHNLLYNNQGPIDSGWVSNANLKKFASQIPGLNMQQFNSCFESQKYEPLAEHDLAIAHAFGFTNSPSFIVAKSDGSNPQKIEGAQPFIAFKTVIDKELGG